MPGRRMDFTLRVIFLIPVSVFAILYSGREVIHLAENHLSICDWSIVVYGTLLSSMIWMRGISPIRGE